MKYNKEKEVEKSTGFKFLGIIRSTKEREGEFYRLTPKKGVVLRDRELDR